MVCIRLILKNPLKNNINRNYNVAINIFLLGPVGIDGKECAVTCPMECGKDMMNCPGHNNNNGCQMPDTCMPTKGGAS